MTDMSMKQKRSAHIVCLTVVCLFFFCLLTGVAVADPHVEITEISPAYIVQGDSDVSFVNELYVFNFGEDIIIEGIADGDIEKVIYYIFGENYFGHGNLSVSESLFTMNVNDVFDTEEYIGRGPYILVIQHPMYDKCFNIAPIKGDIVLNKSGDVFFEESGTILFSVYSRQWINAAHALCDALDSQEIDDTYVMIPFILTGSNSGVFSIPQGTILNFSGTNPTEIGNAVTVELFSTAYSALPKEAIPLSSIITNTSSIDEFGLWSVFIDTSNIKGDEYSCTISIGENDIEPIRIKVIANPNNHLLLKSGWNFVSVPKKLSADYNTAAELFAGVNTNNNAILSYNAKTQAWEQVNSDTEIVPLNAYWIYSVDEKEITPSFDTGAYVPAAKSVYKGWNAVGLSAQQPMSAVSAFNNIMWRTYLPWNNEIQAYDMPLIKGNKDVYSEDVLINLWKGGWLFMDEENTIIGYA